MMMVSMAMMMKILSSLKSWSNSLVWPRNSRDSGCFQRREFHPQRKRKTDFATRPDCEHWTLNNIVIYIFCWTTSEKFLSMHCFSFKSCLIWFYFTCIWTQCPDRQQSAFWLESTRDGKRERCRKDLGRTWKTDQAFTFKDFHFQQSYKLNDKLCLKVFVHFTWGGKRSQQRGCLGSLENSTPAFKIITVRCEIFPVKSITGLPTFFQNENFSYIWYTSGPLVESTLSCCLVQNISSSLGRSPCIC